MKYSQNDEQDYVLDYFHNFKGTFMDCGSNDGVTLSNTYALSKLGWRGTCVDASEEAFKRLRKNYLHNHNIEMYNYAIGDENKEVTFFESGELLGSGDTALVSSLMQQEMDRWKGLNMKFVPKQVEMITFKTLLSKIKHKHFHLISIDLEGCERMVVPQIDFKALDTKMAIIEFNGRDEGFFTEYMSRFNFKLVHKNAENLIFQL
jgi:FkbM family methyltransferase